ncbi:ferritin-like domain-containing protein [Halorussus halophilus]|uniref:ferritin-like domain-containing protein n=1 Tax=Halorussus halophilus TaxID=2650975 RepID=UPI00130197DC|nr:ferritin-like domain-containing protein [Halorussus halophilus]
MSDHEGDEWGTGEQLRELAPTTRRAFLESSAKVGGGALALSLGGAGAVAATGGQESEDGPSDVDILNYALTLEHLEYAFYRDGLEQFSEGDLAQSKSIRRLTKGVQYSVTDLLEVVRDHEKAHVDALTEVVTDLGGEPVGEAEYDFGYSNATEFVAIAQALENTGVAAYAGAAPAIQNDEILSAALSIHSVEARHASILNFANGDSPFPDAFDPAQSMEEVIEIASQFIVEG